MNKKATLKPKNGVDYHIIHIYDPVFNVSIHTIISPVKHLEYIVNRYGDEVTKGFMEDIENCGGRMMRIKKVPQNSHLWLIWLASLRHPQLSHEIRHVVDDIMELVGVKDTETNAYYTEFLHRKITQELAERKKKHNRRKK